MMIKFKKKFGKEFTFTSEEQIVKNFFADRVRTDGIAADANEDWLFDDIVDFVKQNPQFETIDFLGNFTKWEDWQTFNWVFQNFKNLKFWAYEKMQNFPEHKILFRG